MSKHRVETEVTEDKTKQIENRVHKLVQTMHKNGTITDDLKSYLMPSGGTSGRLQGNPKIHKTNIPLRTIVNGRHHPTEKMAEVVEQELREHVTSLPSYIKDTTDFLKKVSQIPQPLPIDTMLFCFDVVALYPSVPRVEARKAIENALNRRSNQSIPTNDVLEMMDMVLENDNISFADKHFIQKEGTAIGSHLGMNYASTYLGEWEKQLLQQARNLPYSYYRYVDDVWGLWTHGEEALKRFHELANSIHPRIQVTLRCSINQLEFLDVLTSITDTKLETDLFSKPTDKHLYLHKQSSHPDSTKKSIPYGLGVRIKRICSDNKHYLCHRQELKRHLQDRGYEAQFIEKELKKVDTKERTDLLGYNTHNKR